MLLNVKKKNHVCNVPACKIRKAVSSRAWLLSAVHICPRTAKYSWGLAAESQAQTFGPCPLWYQEESCPNGRINQPRDAIKFEIRALLALNRSLSFTISEHFALNLCSLGARKGKERLPKPPPVRRGWFVPQHGASSWLSPRLCLSSGRSCPPAKPLVASPTVAFPPHTEVRHLQGCKTSTLAAWGLGEAGRQAAHGNTNPCIYLFIFKQKRS